MSSPLTFFRRNQKTLLGVFGVLLMIVFVVELGWNPGTSTPTTGPKQEAVVTWKHGKLYERDLWAMREAHNLVVRFLDLLVQKTIEAKGQPKGLGVTMVNGRVFDPGIPRSYAEEDLVQTMILAQKAEDLGVRLSDDAIHEFLETLSDDVVPSSQFGALLKEATHGRFGKAQLFEQLRTELLAQHMRMMAGSGMFAMSPTLAWDAFNRMNRRVKVELLPLSARDFKDKVTAQPTEEQISALYEEGKSRSAAPDLPDVGFKRRRKIAFQYLKSDFDKYLQQEMAAVTKEQVADYYEKNKADFKVTEEAKPAEAKPVEAKPAEAKAAEAKPAETKPAEAKPAEAKPEPANPSDAPSAEPARTAAPTPKEPAAKEVELDLDPPAAPTKSPPAKEGAPKQSRYQTPRRHAETLFVSYNAGEPDKDPAPETANEASKGDAKAAAKEAAKAEAPKEPPKEPAEAGKPEPSAAKPDAAPQKPTVVETKPAETKPAMSPPPAPSAAAPAKEEKKEVKKDGPPAKYRPLAEVEEEIRRNLARAPAQDKVTQAFNGARTEIRKFFQAHASWRAKSKAKLDVPEPTPPDVKQLGEKFGLIGGEIPLVDELQIGDYELGKAFRFSFEGNQFRRQSFAQIAYTDKLPLYQPDQIRSFEVDVEFLYWKTKEEEAFVPALQDIRAEVVDAWKLREAYALARAEAEKLAKAAKGDKPLKESLDEKLAKTVLEPPEFTWLTRGAMPMGSGAPMLNVVEGVEHAGQEFMQAVFALKPGQVGVAANTPHTVVYVVRLVSESPDEEQRRRQFVEGGLTGDMGFLARVELQSFLNQWHRELEKEMQVKWSRPPEVSQAID